KARATFQRSWPLNGERVWEVALVRTEWTLTIFNRGGRQPWPSSVELAAESASGAKMQFARISTTIQAMVLLGALAGFLSNPTTTVAQDQSDNADATEKVTPAQAASALPPGTTICAELTRSLDARRLNVGDKVEARTTLAVLACGIVAIPEGSKLLGHVTAVAARSEASERSVVGILFDKVELKGKAEVPISLTLQAIGERPLHALVAPEFAGRLDNG